MFKKLIAAMLILGFASAVPVMAQGAKVPAIYKADLSSKEATVRTCMLAAYHNKAEIWWECFAPSTQKQFEQLLKKQNISLQEIKKYFCHEMHTSLRKELSGKYKGNFDQMVKDCLKDVSFSKINGKWYIDFKE